MSNLIEGGALVGEVMPDEPMRITVNSNDAFDADAVQQLYETMLASLSLIHISEPTRRHHVSRMPSSA